MKKIFSILTVFSFILSFFNTSFAEVRYDFDGDGKTDPTLRLAAAGQEYWHILGSSSGYFVTPWGFNELENFSFQDFAAMADYDGDGKTDFAVWREPLASQFPQIGRQAYFYILYSSTGTFAAIPWGNEKNQGYYDFPAKGDFDGDGKADVAISRQSVGTSSDQLRYFYIIQSGGGIRIEQFGRSGDVSVTADYDGDGKTDLAVARRTAQDLYDFYIKQSSDGNWQVKTLGNWNSDYLRPGDYDGDGKADIAVWSGRSQFGTGYWTWIRSSDGRIESVKWGFNELTDDTAQGDYDGDGITDLAVYRVNRLSECNVPSYFWIRGSKMGTKVIQFGSCHTHVSYDY